MPLYTILRQHPHMGLTPIGRRHLRDVVEKLLGIDVSADEMLQ